jgi:hypothetical protein
VLHIGSFPFHPIKIISYLPAQDLNFRYRNCRDNMFEPCSRGTANFQNRPRRRVATAEDKKKQGFLPPAGSSEDPCGIYPVPPGPLAALPGREPIPSEAGGILKLVV